MHTEARGAGRHLQYTVQPPAKTITWPQMYVTSAALEKRLGETL